jgi:N-acyl-D-amino-acid deacylase
MDDAPRSRRSAAPLLLLMALPALACSQGPEPLDLLITGGTILDGTGTPGFAGDVGIRDGRIVRVSREPLDATDAAGVIDAAGLVVAPGFIDLHAHLEPLPMLPGAESHVRQGVTTALGGPDGSSPWPVGEYLDKQQTDGVGMNIGMLVGHNTIRREVMQAADRAPTDGELARMQEMVGQAMDEGAFGLSTGLRYIPGAFAGTEEVIALARVAGERGGIYTSHLRDEGFHLLEGVQEGIRIGAEAEIPVILTHHKVVGAPMWGSSAQTVALIDSARAQGIDVSADQYPYTASHTGISILVPSWALADGDNALQRRLEDPVLRDSIRAGLLWNLVNDRGGNDLSRVQFSTVSWDRSLEGRTLRDWAERDGLDTGIETGVDLVLEAMRRGGANAIFHVMDEEDIERIMRHPETVPASDGRLSEPGVGHPHPRAYGTFPRVLGRYVRERGVLTLEDAVRRMTSLAASRLGLEDRGRIAEGAWADLVLFDPATVVDRSTFAEPHQYPEGIPWVIINGVPAVADGVFTDLRPGTMLRRPGSPGAAAQP